MRSFISPFSASFALRLAIGFSAPLAIATLGHAQVPAPSAPVPSAPALADNSSPLAPSAPLLVVAGFTEPARAIDWGIYHTPAGCAGLFDRALKAAAYQRDTLSYAHGPDTGPDTYDVWAPFPANTIALAQHCIRQLPAVDAIADSAMRTVLLNLAIATNQDSLVNAIVARELTLAGQAPVARAAVFLKAIRQLLSHTWWYPGYLTAAHVTLATQYEQQLEALGSTVIRESVDALYAISNIDSDHQTLETQIANTQKIVTLLNRAVSVSDIPASRRAQLQDELRDATVAGLWFTYLKTGNHDDFTRYRSAQAAIFLPNAILGTPAPPITGDYWFNRPPGAFANVPALGQVSLVCFTQPSIYTSNASDIYKRLRKLHAQFPTLQIILVSATKGSFQGQDFLGHPEQEAERIHAVLTDSFKVPGILAVTKGVFKKIAVGHTLPLPLPLLDAYHIDPRENQVTFLVDAQGWIVAVNRWDEMTIRELLAHATTAAPSAQSTHTSAKH